MKSRITVLSVFFACSLAQAEGFTAYYVQRINNGQLSSKITCEVLFSRNGGLELLKIVAPKDNVTDWEGKKISSAVILGSGFYVSSEWDPDKGCDNPSVKKPLPKPLTQPVGF